MAIDTTTEQILTFAEAARQSRPGRARSLAPSTLWRWHRKGISGVRLETICLGGIRYTSVEALQRFFAAVTEAKSAKASGHAVEEGQRNDSRESRLRESGLL